MNPAAAPERIRSRRAVIALFAIAIVARLAVVRWAWGHFPPIDDGTFFHTFAGRLARGQGYTWAWPDGAVTPVAHYPVGYPALLSVAYRVCAGAPEGGMLINAVVGALLAPLVYDLTRGRTGVVAGLVAGLHPALVLYTPAIMTEGVTASLLVMACWVGVRTRRPLVAGIACGFVTLIRPQSIAFAPVFGALALCACSGPWQWRSILRGAALGLAGSFVVCLPWTLRNCVRMDQCTLVSANGGWNLLIGAQTTSGAWHAATVPFQCATEFGEVAKDACFGRVARAVILASPWEWLLRAPQKLLVTFDYFGAAPYYLHTSNPALFSERAKMTWGGIESIVFRASLAASHLAMARLRAGPVRWISLLLAGLALFPGFAWVTLAMLSLLSIREGVSRRSPLLLTAACVVFGTIATHAVFFGAGRYGMVVIPWVLVIAATLFEMNRKVLPRSRTTTSTLSVNDVQTIADG